MLPTPQGRDGEGSRTLMSPDNAGRRLDAGRRNLEDALSVRLLPTPERSDGSGGRRSAEVGGTRPSGAKRAVTLATAVMLPTPTSRDWKDGACEDADVPTNGLLGRVASRELGGLLPTPTAERYGSNRSVSPDAATRPSLHTLASGELLPTPMADPDSANGHARHLAGEVVDDQWGPYTAAVRRQEQAFGRPAPAPTQTGPNGGQQLAPRFTEWMQAWPAGWVTDVPGLTRTEQLRICGNGVVTPQAEAAIDDLVAIALQSVGVDATLGT